MAFTDLTFIGFVAAVVLVYFAVPKRIRWAVLLVASYAFLWLNSGWLLLIAALSTYVAYSTARLIELSAQHGADELDAQVGKLSNAEKKNLKATVKLRSRRILSVGITIDLGLLLFLKYYNFFANNINVLVGNALPELHLLLPIGISFWTLQAIAYMTDVYRGKCPADHNLFKFALFMSFFPQIIQGPIPRHNRLASQLYEPHDFDYFRLCHGCQLVLWGWFQKLVIADRLAIPVNQLFNNHANYHGLIVFCASALYGLQVYTDFSGGMDVARGVSQIIGVELDLNFRQPYYSRSIEEFWRRWHITLGSWMKDYVFYPLSLSKAFVGVSRKARKYLGQFAGKRLPPIMAMFIVYFIVGFWHGSSWKYIAYGVWNGTFIVAGILLPELYGHVKAVTHIDEKSRGWRFFQMFRTFVVCSIGRFFSRGTRLRDALAMIASMSIGWNDLSFITDGTLVTLGLDTANWILLIAAIIVLFIVDSAHERGLHIREGIDRQHVLIRWAIYYAALFSIIIFGIYGPGYDPAGFIYEQF